MKRFYSIFALLFAVSMITFAAPQTKGDSQESTSKPSAVSTLHQDVKDVVSTVHEDAKAITSTLYGDGKDAVTTLYPEVKSAVVSIAKALGVAAEHVYMVLVKKFVVDGIVQTLIFVLGIVLLIVGWFKFDRYVKSTTKVTWLCLYPLAILVAGIVTLTQVDYTTMMMGLVNPEYGALNYILEYSKSLMQ